LLPPDVREWLPADHLAWFVIDAVAEMELSAFYAAYRVDGHGRGAYEPSMMGALVLYAFATNQRSSRAIERHCRQDVAYRVITGNLIPDHATIARFICRHERALAELFGEVLGLCDRAGLVKRGVVSIDGTRIAGDASPGSTATSSRSPGRSSPRRGRPTRPRTSSMARGAAMSCPSGCARRRADASSSARPGKSCGVTRRTVELTGRRENRQGDQDGGVG
jgi:transposase